MNDRIGEKGLIKGIFIVAVLVAVVFLLISFGTPYYRYYMLGSHTRDILKLEIGNTDAIRSKNYCRSKELMCPLRKKS